MNKHGRRPINGVPMERVSVSLPASDLEQVFVLGNNNISAGLRIVIAAYFAKQAPKPVLTNKVTPIIPQPRGTAR